VERQRVLLEPAYLLHQRPYGELHAILEVFAREHGRVGLIARGVRSPRSRRRTLLQPFTALLLSWDLRGELGLLTEVEARGAPALGGRTLISGLYLNELLVRLLRRDDPHPVLYDRYAAVLRRLGEAAGEAAALRSFERDLLEQLGYGLQLEHDYRGTAIEPASLYDYRLEEGPVLAGTEPALPVHGDTLLALAADRLRTPRQLHEAKRLMRGALAIHLGERPLKSRELYAKRLRSRTAPTGEGPDGS
jgi:DNA repair protein RecO (recombination protein O)